MTFQDLRSGCCSTIRTPTTTRLVKTSSLQQIASSQRCCLTGPHTFIASHSSFNSHISAVKNLNAIKASVPKLFNCPGAINFTLTSFQRQGFVDQRGRFQPLDEPTTPWDLSRSEPQEQPQCHKTSSRSDGSSVLRNSLSAPAQDKNITPLAPFAQQIGFRAAAALPPRAGT